MEKEIEISVGTTLDGVIKILLEAKEKGEHVYCVFNGHKLHSDTISVDSAYMEVMGCTKEECEKKVKEIIEKNERVLREADQKAKENRKNYLKEEKRKAMEKIPSWIERGEKIIFPERYKEWEEYVNTFSTMLYYGEDIEESLEIMEALDNGVSMDEAKKIFKDQGHSLFSGSHIREIVFEFSNKGPEFWEATTDEEIPLEGRQKIDAKKQENIQLAEANAKKNEPARHM